MTERKFEPEHAVTYWQARCTKCGHICDEYGDYTAFGDAESAIEHVTDCGEWFSRWTYEPAPTADNPRARIGDLVELLCEDCQQCEVCGSKTAYEHDDHLVCADHEGHDFSAVSA